MFKKPIKLKDKKIVYLLISIVSLFLTLLFYFYLLPIHSFCLHNISLIKRTDGSAAQRFYYDLNNDGETELIELKRNFDFLNESAIKLTNLNNKLIDQWNLKEQWMVRGWTIGDYNHDSFKEIYIITRKDDSLFIYVLDPFKKKDFVLYRTYLASAAQYNPAPGRPWNFGLDIPGFFDLDQDGFDELLVSINAYFALRPRRLFAFSVEKEKLIAVSPEFGSPVHGFEIADINNDGQPEIYNTGSYAPGNYSEDAPDLYKDNHVYLFILNRKLKPKYNPMTFGSTYSAANFKLLKSGKAPLFLGIISNKTVENDSIEFVLFNPLSGIIKKDKSYNEVTPIYQYEFNHYKLTLPLYLKSSSGIYRVDSSLTPELVLKKDSPSVMNDVFWLINLDSDPENEIVRFSAVNADQMKLTVYRQNFKNPVSQIIPIVDFSKLIMSVKKTDESHSELMLSTFDTYLEFNYGRNPYYPWYFVISTLAYGVIFIVLWLIFSAVNSLLFYYHFLIRHLNTLNKGVLLLNEHGRVIRYNQNFLKMLALPENIKFGVDYRNFLRSRPQIRNFIDQLVHTRRVVEGELTFLKSGNPFKGKLVGYFLTGAMDLPAGYCLEIYDLSKSILTEREDVIHRLIRKMAHDIKTPLSTIKFSLQTLKYNLLDQKNADWKEDLRSIETEVTRIHSITENYSKFARLSRLKLQVISLEELIKKVLDAFQPPEHVQISVQIADQAEMITADVEQLEVLLRELLENAFDAVGERGQIRIETFSAHFTNKLHKEAICIRISDDGRGIPKEIEERIFEPNFSTKSLGTGFGLVLVERIVKNHGGQIIVDSVINKGTQVQVILPKDNPS
ncbi:MAG: hypothetical protein GXO77_11595 [Calditrichaeota bacterium]|nr:hypothetical protein [Calditrichota bacterium]